MEKANLKGKNNIFAVRLKNLMENAEKNKVTQQQLADVLNLKRQTISLYLNGETLPPLEKLVDIAKFFNVSTDYLLGLSNVKTSNVDIKAMCQYTGLSEKSLEVLNTYTDYCSIETLETSPFFETINKLIENAEEGPLDHYINLYNCEPENDYLKIKQKEYDSIERIDLLTKIEIFFDFCLEDERDFQVSLTGDIHRGYSPFSLAQITNKDIFDIVMLKKIEEDLKKMRKTFGINRLIKVEDINADN